MTICILKAHKKGKKKKNAEQKHLNEKRGNQEVNYPCQSESIVCQTTPMSDLWENRGTLLITADAIEGHSHLGSFTSKFFYLIFVFGFSVRVDRQMLLDAIFTILNFACYYFYNLAFVLEEFNSEEK